MGRVWWEREEWGGGGQGWQAGKRAGEGTACKGKGQGQGAQGCTPSHQVLWQHRQQTMHRDERLVISAQDQTQLCWLQ